MTVFDLIKKHEGERRQVYDDADGKTIVPGKTVTGNATIGVGRNLVGKGLTQDEIDYLLNNDVAEVQAFLNTYPWFPKQDVVIQAALIDLCFNEGPAGFGGFVKMIAALAINDYQTAGAEIMNSKGARQLPGRYTQLSQMVKTGQWPSA
jgi:lysozyme